MGIAFFIGFLDLFWGITIAYVGAVYIYVSNPSIRRKKFTAMGILFIASSILLNWPFGYILPMGGYVKDKKTGLPIENAIFEIEWLYNYVSAAGGSRQTFDKTYVVSGKDGKYQIDGRIMVPFPVNSYGVSQKITLRYPLFMNKDCYMNECAENLVEFTDEDPWKEMGSGKGYVWRKPHFRPRFGRINRNFEMDRGINLSDIDSYYDLAMHLGVARDIDWSGIIKECSDFVAELPAGNIKESEIKHLGWTQAKVSGERYYAK